MERALPFTLLIVAFVTVSFGQKRATETWLRVITEDDYVVDVDRTSLVLEKGQVIKASFRTTYTKLEPLTSGRLTYRTRIDTLAFRTNDRAYRTLESSYLSETDKILFRSSSDEKEWKWPSRTGKKLFSAATQLAPFGRWKVLSYRYASGEGPSKDDPPELTSLVGAGIMVSPNNLFIGNSNCPGGTLDFASITDEQAFRRLGIKLSDLGIEADTLQVMRVNCSSNPGYQGAFVFLLSSDKAKLLWNGVFFDLERPGNVFVP